MSRYLIVTHQTASSPELVERVREVVAGEPGAEFAVLVPELPRENFSWEGENVDVAERRSEAAAAALTESAGAQVVRTAVGVADPLQAIADELAAHRDYDALIICTLPLGISRWLQLDLVHQATRRFDLPVTHVVAQPAGVANR